MTSKVALRNPPHRQTVNLQSKKLTVLFISEINTQGVEKNLGIVQKFCKTKNRKLFPEYSYDKDFFFLSEKPPPLPPYKYDGFGELVSSYLLMQSPPY